VIRADFVIEDADLVATCAGSKPKRGAAQREIVPVKANGEIVDSDEQPTRSDPAKIPQLKPAFREGGSVTAANSSSISDGAAALILMSEGEANRNALRPLARIVGHATHAQEPAWFTTAPVGAIEKLLEKIGSSSLTNNGAIVRRTNSNWKSCRNLPISR